MNRICVIVALWFLLQVNLSSQCYVPFVEKECYLNPEINLSQSWKEVTERHIELWGTESSYLYHFEEEAEVINGPKYKYHLDSLYHVCMSYLLDALGTQLVCARMEFEDFSQSSIRHGGDKIWGEFRFDFYYDEVRKCWNDDSDNIVFRFKEVDSLEFELSLPKHLPECGKDEKCPYLSLSNEQWINKAISDGLVDGTEDIDLFKHEFKYMALSYYDGLAKTHYLFYSLKSGNFVKDTTICQTADWRKGVRNCYSRSELIVDARCIREVPFDATDIWSPKNYYFEIHHLIKGRIDSDTIIVPVVTMALHSFRMPSVGKRAILYLEKDGYLSRDESNPNDLNSNKLWYPLIQPTFIDNGTNLYTEILPALVELDSLKVVKAPNYLPREVSNRLKFHKKEEVLGEKGLLLRMDNEFWSYDNTKWISHLYAFSCGDFTYPTELTFDIEYDSSISGPYIVDRDLVSLSHLEQEKDDRILTPRRSLSNNYQFQLYDVAPNKFRVTIVAKDVGQLCQVQIEDGSRKFEYKPLLSIAIDVVDTTDNFILNLDRNIELRGKHYCLIENAIRDYDYIAIGSRQFTIDRSRNLKIDSTPNKDLKVGDTLQEKE